MANIRNRAQLQKASNEEIEDFFSKTVFEGVFSFDVKSTKNAEFYKGSITHIKLDGRPTDLVPPYLNVPKTSKNIAKGPCSFLCRINTKDRVVGEKYVANLVGASLKSIPSLTESNMSVPSQEITNKDLFDLWGVDNCQCIGFYHYDADRDVYVVDDLRKPNFDYIYYLGDDKQKPIRITYPRKIVGIELDNYYLFTWKLSHKNPENPYELHLDFTTQPQAIDPKWFIETLFNDRLKDNSKNFGSATNFLDTLRKQLSAKESTFVYELLQNANDYPVEGQSVDVEFHITDNYLLFLHSGEKFNVRNISGICGINEKEKVSNKKTIGYKGIGFKTVFLHNHYVYIRTGDYSFRFDEGETPEKKVGGKIKRMGAPYPILPIWTEHHEVAPEVNQIFDQAKSDFRVQIALRPDSNTLLHVGKNSYENLFRDVFSDSNIILFIPNIHSVRVYINGEIERSCFRNNDEWIVGDYESEIDDELQSNINKTIEKHNTRIPEKYIDFDCTKVSFACKHKGEIVQPVDKATLYCYLPTGASWGLPFLMNTDMIPKGDRNDIETEVKLIDDNETNFNEELAAIAGSKLFQWIKDLLLSSKYNLGSIFALIPDFKKCKKEHDLYSNFIERFESSFNECLENDALVPVRGKLALVNKVILDTTGLSTSGIMSDEEFCKFAGMEEYSLPLEDLRKDKNFITFLKRYATEDQKFDKDSLTAFITNEDFKTWLKVQDNNNKFLNFLLENDYLEAYFDEEIFIDEECGNLFSANDLYYDIDEDLKDLSAFSAHLFYLSFKTREYFKGNERWTIAIEDHFAEYDCENFIKVTLLQNNLNETITALKEWETSSHFYHYLAKNTIVPENLRSLPFFNDESNVVDNFNGKFVFFSSSEGKRVCSASWLSSVTFSFISSLYDKNTLTYLATYAGVLVYSDDIIVQNIILSEDYQEAVNASQQENNDSSVAFVQFCFAHKPLFAAGSLCNYALNAADCTGEQEFVLSEDHVYFPSTIFDTYSEKAWLGPKWMYCLDSKYLTIDTDETGVRDFLSTTFAIADLTSDKFYKEIIRPNISDIIASTSGSNDVDGLKSLDFISYLDANYNLVFVQKNDADKFAAFVLLEDSTDGEVCDISADAAYVYAYDSELEEILKSNWFPADTVNMCTSKYGTSKAILAIKAKKYDFATFFNEVITTELPNINNTIQSKESSIAFHAFIIERLADLTNKQKAIMRNAKVYLYGNSVANSKSEGHHILSTSASELASMKLVQFADLDIIDPDYDIEKNKDYWETQLGNVQFTVSDFIAWLNTNTTTFCTTIKDKECNVKFWRWVKGCNLSDQTLKTLPVLPVYLTTNNSANLDEIIYLSDDYVEEGGLEVIVNSYHPNAPFLSRDYIAEKDSIESWRDFWVKMGVRFEMIDILIDTIDHRLSETLDAKLPATIAKYRLKLAEHYGELLLSKLTDLQVLAYDGEFHPLSEVIYIDCEKAEPFKYIVLPTQASFATADERTLINDILEGIDSAKKITKLVEWQQAKINRYLEIQNNPEQSELLRSIHYNFVNELAKLYNEAEKDGLKEFTNITNVYFLSSQNEFCEAATLTEGSIYHPFCDFEQYNLEYAYISDSYKVECSNDVRKMLNKVFKIHCDFKKEDIKNLSDRSFSIYFWSQYLCKKDADISGVKKLIDEREFDAVACIPTKDCMKKPGELYSLSIAPYVTKHVVDWENKLPLQSLPEIEYDKAESRTLFGLLLNKPSNLRLSFSDALDALLSIAGQERRTQLLQWMIDTYEEKYVDEITEYRANEHAVWKNTKNEDMPISKLYALSYNDKKLEQYFGSLPQIINKDYFPAGATNFRKACDILQITTIEPNELIVDPIEKISQNEAYKNDLKIYALVLAGFEGTETWKAHYYNYIKLIDSMELWCCTAISIRYEHDENICKKLKKFYHAPGSTDFYFVKSLTGQLVLVHFINSFIEYLGIEADKDFVETIMENQESALEAVKENNALMLDSDFTNELDLLIPGIKRELNGNVAVDQDVIDENKRHLYKGYTEDSDSEDTFTGSSDSIDNAVNDNDEEQQQVEDKKLHEKVPANNVQGVIDRPNNHHLDAETGTTNGVHDSTSRNTTKPVGSTESRSETPHKTGEKADASRHPYTNHDGWEDKTRHYRPMEPKPFSPEDVRNFESNGCPRTLDVLPPSKAEIDDINRILDEQLTAEQVADQNYLAQLRLYRNLLQHHMQPQESVADFVRNAGLKNEHSLCDGKYIHKCSAIGGIMYLSPSIWNKIEDDNCVVCVYLGAKANDFMYFNTIEEILQWIKEDDIVIKLTGEEKANVVQTLYSGVLNGVKGTAYTLIRINSNEKYNSLFAPLSANEASDGEENANEY